MIIFARHMPGIHEDDRAFFLFPLIEILFHHRPELQQLLLGDVGISIAWNIDEHVTVIQVEKVQQPGLAWRISHISELAPPAHGVDEAALADI